MASHARYPAIVPVARAMLAYVFHAKMDGKTVMVSTQPYYHHCRLSFCSPSPSCLAEMGLDCGGSCSAPCDCGSGGCACAPYNFGDGVVPGDAKPCQGADVLREGESCNVKCGIGYDVQEATISCAVGALQNADTTGGPTCVERTTCARYWFHDGVIPGDSNPCVDSEALEAGATCNIKCGTGYLDQEATISCSADAAHGDMVTGEAIFLFLSR